MSKAKKIIIISLFLIITLVVARVVVLNSIATNGIEVSEMQQELMAIQRENSILREHILERSSLTSIASEAATLGFVAERKELLLIQAPPIALKQ